MKTNWAVRRSVFGVLLLMVVVTMSACPPSGLVCDAPTVTCGSGCADTSSDRRNCGGCERACAEGQECVGSACTCLAGSTECGGRCVQLAFDTKNCGACGKACEVGQICNAGTCQTSCPQEGTAQCGSLTCVTLASDNANCGGCGLQCQSGESCRLGQCTVDVVAACFNTGQLVGFSRDTFRKTPLRQVGAGPQSLAVLGDSILSADTIAGKLYQAVVRAAGIGPSTPRALDMLSKRNADNVTGEASNHVLAAGNRVLVVNSGVATLQLFEPAVGALKPLGEVSFGANTFPQVAAVLGDDAWVSLYGGFDNATAAAGQKVARVSLKEPTKPVVMETISLADIDLKPEPGLKALARPAGIVAHRNALYVALNNLTVDYTPAGPGFLAKIDASSKAVTAFNLGADCQNPGWVAVAADNLVVSCSGKTFVDSPTGASVLLVNAQGTVLSTWKPKCDADAGMCLFKNPSRLRVWQNQVFVADSASGNVAALDIVNNLLIEKRGPSTAEGSVDLCPKSSMGYVSVFDVEVVP